MGFPTAEAAKPLTDQLRRPMNAASAAMVEQQIRAMVTGKADQEMVIGWSHASSGEVTGRAYAEDIVMDLRPGLADNRVPTTLIYPRGDAFGLSAAQTDAQYQGAFKGMPNLTLRPVDGSRHFVMLDQPDRFAAELDAFLKA
jgi:pimeloyl-ACP methyl ester carboxylesterase